MLEQLVSRLVRAGRRAIGLGTSTIELGGLRPRFRVHTQDEYVLVKSANGERRPIEALLADLAPSSVFYDVGANVGLYTVPASLKGATVVAFEPSPSNVFALKANLDLNRLSNVVVEPIALAETTGTLPFYVSAGGAGAQVNTLDAGVAAQFGTAAKSILVRVDRLDDVVERRALPAPDVIKVDVEGAEGPVLRGAAGILRTHGPILHVELHPGAMEAFGDSISSIESWLAGLGYHVVREDGPLTSRLRATRPSKR